MDPVAQGGDRSHYLVPEDRGRFHQAVVHFGHVSRAEPASLYLDQELAGADVREGEFFQANLLIPLVDRCPHRSRLGFTVHGSQFRDHGA